MSRVIPEVIVMDWKEFAAMLQPLVDRGVNLDLLSRESVMTFFIKSNYTEPDGPVDWTLEEVIADNSPVYDGRPYLYPIHLQEIMAASTTFGLIPNGDYLVHSY